MTIIGQKRIEKFELMGVNALCECESPALSFQRMRLA